MDNINTSRYSRSQITQKNDNNNIDVDQEQQVQNINQHLLLAKHGQNISCYLNQNETEPLYNNSLCYDQGAVGLSFGDSGYTSYNLTGNRHSSVILPRIDEDSEVEQRIENLNSATTTPVTRNIHKINALHLTTPNDKMSLYGACSVYQAAKESPIKRTITYENMEYTPKKTRTEMIQMTPPKSSPRNMRRLINSSTKRRNPSFRDTLYTLTENENEFNADNIENESIENNISGMDFSPIPSLKLKTPNATNVLQEKRVPLETTAENRLQSSTPFNTAYQPQFYIKNDETILRNKLLPKSASPKRRQQTFLKKNPSVDLGLLSMQSIQNTQYNFNPAKKLLHFDTEKSTKKLLPENTKKTENNILKNKNDTCDYSNNSLDDVFLAKNAEICKEKPVKRVSLQRQNAIETTNIVPEINFGNNDNNNIDSMVEACLTPEPCRHATNINLFDNDLSILTKPIINEHFLKTPIASPIKNIDDNSINDFSFQLENSSKSDDKQLPNFNLDNLLTGKILTLEKEKNLNLFNERLLTTPKKITRCRSLTQQQHHQNELQHIPQGISADAEKNIILHPYLPCTPPKKNILSKTFLKRLNSFRIKCNTMKKTKTKLFTIDKKFNYVGKRYVDILDSLKNTAPPLERIFFYLNGKDIANCSMVSRCWKYIIENSKKVNKKRLNYIKKIAKIKENRCAIDKNNVTLNERRKLTRFPFNSTSINIEPNNTVIQGSATVLGGRKRVATLERSPPVSPSKRKFHENQKIVRQLDKNVKLTKCPRCTMSSEIIRTETLNSQNNNNLNEIIDVLDTTNRPNLLIRTPVKNNTKPQVQRANTICASTVTTSTNNNYNSCNKLSATTLINFNNRDSILSASPIKIMKRPNYICKLDFSSSMNDDNNERNCHRRTTRSSMNNLLTDNHKKFISLDNLDIFKTEKKIFLNNNNNNNNSKKLNDSKNSLVSSNNNNNNNNNENIIYAVCLGTTCGFKFCIKCLCEYHDDILHKCMECDYGQLSPSRDDDQILVNSHTSVGSRQSKRILRRL